MMAEEGVEVRMYLDHVKVVVEEATEEALKQLAFRIVERTQLKIRENDQIDTGFMVNSVYPTWKEGSGYETAAIEADSHNVRKTGEVVGGIRMAPEESLPEDATAGVVVGANYAVFQEAANPFLYPAAEAAAGEFGGLAEKIYQEELPEEGSKV